LKSRPLTPAFPPVIRITRVLRPLLIVNFSENRNLRKLLRNIKRTVLDVARSVHASASLPKHNLISDGTFTTVVMAVQLAIRITSLCSVLVLIFLFIGVFAMMATKFFERRTLIDPQGDPYLDNFLDSYWNL